jgi:hypothetical protein
MSRFAFDAYARTPQEIGLGIAEGMRGTPLPQFLEHLDDRLEQVRDVLLYEGFAAPVTFEICRVARQIAQEQWRQATR